MSPGDRLQAGQLALQHDFPHDDVLVPLVMGWFLLVILLCAWHPVLASGIAVVHVGCSRLISGRFDLQEALLGPPAVLMMLPNAVRARSPLRTAYAQYRRRVVSNKSLPMPGYPLVAPGQALNLRTGTLIGSMHAQMEDRRQRTEMQNAGIITLMRDCPDGILVSDHRGHLVIDAHGIVVGQARIVDLSPQGRTP